MRASALSLGDESHIASAPDANKMCAFCVRLSDIANVLPEGCGTDNSVSGLLLPSLCAAVASCGVVVASLSNFGGNLLRRTKTEFH